MRNILLGLAALAAAGLPTAPSHAQTPPDRVEVVYHPDAMFFSGEEGGEARRVALPVRLDPDRLTFTDLYWGRTVQEWSIPRGGEGRWSQVDGKSETFPVSVAEFDRLRDIFRPYEGVRFECQRVIADGPYGTVTWSQQGHEDQQLRWDAGCVTGDAADVFRRLDEAEVLLKSLRDR